MLRKFGYKSEGFGIAGIVVAVMVISLVGLVGWRWYEANKPQTGTTTQQQASQNSSDRDDSHSDVDTVSYLEIKELDVKFKLNAGIKDATYYFNTAATSTEPAVRLSTQSLTDKSEGACDPSKTEALGTIYKTNDLALPTGATLKVNNINVFQLGDSYYVYVSPSSPCSPEASISEMQTRQIQSLKEAIKTLQLDH